MGLFIYNTSTNKINYYKSTGWYELSRTFQSSSTGTNSPGGGVSINIAGTAPNTSSILDVNSSTQGLLFPRTNSGSLTATTGLIYYDITLNKLMYYNGTSWKSICETFITTTTGPGSLAPNGVAVNTNGDAPDPSAILDLKSDSKGLLIPRMTSIERSQILPVNGLLVYNTSDNTIDYYNGSDWNKLETDVPSAAGTISGSSSVCQGQNGITFSVSAITGATGYTWSYSGTGFSIATGNNTNSITANFSGTSTSGDLTVYGTNACGNGSVSVAFSITVNALPAQPGVITGTTPVCAGSIENYSISPVAGATSYTWSVPTGATFSNQTTNSGVLYASNSVSTTGIGTVAWSNPGNATTNNASYATASLNNTQSNWLVATGFGFSIPSDATINGIMVEWEQKSSSGTNSLDNAIRIVKNGSIGITDKSNATQWGTSNDVYTPSYGNSSDCGVKHGLQRI